MKKIVLIGASTGGPGHLETIFKEIPEGFDAPVIVAQHINVQFLPTLSESLNLASKIGVKLASANQHLLSGGYLVSKDLNRLALKNSQIFFEPAVENSENSPSVDELFFSAVSLLDSGYKVLAVLLTGIGQDGARGLLELKNRGAKTVAESEKTAVVYGMPRAAYEMGATDKNLDLMDIIDEIVKFGRDL